MYGTSIPAEIARTLVDPRSYADERIHDAYRWLRANNPLGIAEPEGFDPFWAVVKHADIIDVSRQNDLFHSGDRQTTLTDKATDTAIRAMTGGSPHLVKSLVQMDPPEHIQYRALTQGWFMQGSVKKYEERIREIAKAAVEKMLATGGRCDFVRDIGLRYPLHVIMEILGVPEEDEPRMLQLTQELFGAQDPDTQRKAQEASDAERPPLDSVLNDFYAYFEKISADRRKCPRGDLASIIANGSIKGCPITGLEQLSYYVIVATAGHDTTSSTSAGAIWQLAKNPAEFAKLKRDPSLIPSMIEEAIRWVTPVKHFMRSATADTEVAGRKIPKGDWMMLCYASGNRDEDVFEDPYTFKVDRKPNNHIAFGFGGHLCLGQHLARLELRILFEELLGRIDSLELDGEPKQTQAYFVNGPKTVPIRFKAA